MPRKVASYAPAVLASVDAWSWMVGAGAAVVCFPVFFEDVVVGVVDVDGISLQDVDLDNLCNREANSVIGWSGIRKKSSYVMENR